MEHSTSSFVERSLIFDVETTGFFNKNNENDTKPHIIQISFVVMEINLPASSPPVVVKQVNQYVKIDKSVEITKEITKLTGITKEQCDMEGVPIIDVLVDFYNEYMKCQYVVSHNIAFDSRMILTEMERHYHEMVSAGCFTPYAIFNPMFNKCNGIQIYCTMLEGKQHTNLYVSRKRKIRPVITEEEEEEGGAETTFKKNPKLIELYTHLYPDQPTPENLHNSMVDTTVCMECFLKMKYN